MTDAVILIIDDRELSAPPGTLIVDAARQAGIHIPVFCHHPELLPTGSCGMCRVEVGALAAKDGQVRWNPDLQAACTTPVAEGMVVRTQTERVARARQSVLTSLLAHHPLDCLVCDKGGECLLQDQVMAFGEGGGRPGRKGRGDTACRVSLDDWIILHLGRCIQCGRCVRFQAEIADDPMPGSTRSEIDAFPPGSHWSGNMTDICPVGALTLADLRFGARPWELTRHASLCNHCPVGCNVTLDTRVESTSGDWMIKRVRPRQNQEVNGDWICDKGRYGHHHTRAANRLRTPLVRKDGQLVEAAWDEALDLIVRRIEATRPAQIAGVAGDRLSNEDLFLFQSLLRDVISTPHVDAFPHVPGVDLVARYGIGAGSDWNRLGPDSAILVVAADVEEGAPLWFLHLKAAAQRGAKLITVNGRATRLDRYAGHRLRVRYGSAPHLLMGLIRSILKGEGLDKLQADLSALSPAAIERLTGVTASDLEMTAELLSQAEDLIVVFGREGLNDYGALALVQSAANLLLMTNHVGRANNGLLPLWPHNNTQGAADMGVRSNAGPGYQEIIEHGWNFESMLSIAGKGGIRLMWIAGADLVGDDPATAQALAALDFLVVQELFLTDTARLADVVLPALSFAERDGTYTSGDRRVQRFEQALPPLGQARADWAILADVAGRLGAAWDFDSSASVLAAIEQAAPPYAGITLEVLCAAQPQWPPIKHDALFGGAVCQNKDGLGLRWQTETQVKKYPARAFNWVELPTLPDADLHAVSVRWLFRQGTLIDHSTVLNGRLRGGVAEFNPHDAQRLGLNAGMLVGMSLGGRTVELVVGLNRQAPRGVVLVPANLPSGPLAVDVDEWRAEP